MHLPLIDVDMKQCDKCNICLNIGLVRKKLMRFISIIRVNGLQKRKQHRMFPRISSFFVWRLSFLFWRPFCDFMSSHKIEALIWIAYAFISEFLFECLWYHRLGKNRTVSKNRATSSNRLSSGNRKVTALNMWFQLMLTYRLLTCIVQTTEI